MHVGHSSLCQSAKFHSIILKFDEVVPYYARSPRESSTHNKFTTKHKCLISGNKKMAKMHKLLGYYSYKTAKNIQ